MKAKECMSNNVCSCTPSCSVFDVAKMMNEQHVGCIPVCDNKNCMVGIVTVDNQVRRMPVLENGKIIGVLTIGDLINHDCKLGKKEVFNTIDSICDCTDNRKNAQ